MEVLLEKLLGTHEVDEIGAESVASALIKGRELYEQKHGQVETLASSLAVSSNNIGIFD